MKRWRGVAAMVVMLALLASLIPMLATARHAVVRDPKDAKGVLDVRRAEILKGKPRWKVTSWRRWTAKAVWDRGFTLIYVDSFGRGRADYYVLVGSNGRKLTAALYRDRKRGKDRRIRSVRVRHPRRKVVNVTVPLGKLRRRDSGVYRWYVLTLFSGKRCKRVCFDRVPDDGTIAEPGPQPTPTVPPPTPSPTLTPSPTPTVTPTPTPTASS